MDDKKTLRRTVKAAFASLAGVEQAALSALVNANLEACPAFREARTVLFYFPMPDEINILPAARRCLELGRTAVFPVCRPDAAITVHRVTDLERDFETGTYGIHEPRAACPELPAEAIDCIITPGRAFDRSGNRVGRGAGYYDRFFVQAPGLRIAPAFSFQVFANVPAECTDRPVDIIVTEAGLIDCRQALR